MQMIQWYGRRAPTQVTFNDNKPAYTETNDMLIQSTTTRLSA